MVTAILPSMTAVQKMARRPLGPELSPYHFPHRDSITPSLDSEVTITPERYTQRRERPRELGTNGNAIVLVRKPVSSPSRLAGLVGLFTGCGALVALGLFLPMPAQFSRLHGVMQGQAIVYSFYVVGAISLAVAVFCFMGLRGLPGDEDKGWKLLLIRPKHGNGYQDIINGTNEHEGNERGLTAPDIFLPYWRLLLESTLLGLKDAQIGLGYLGGFVARASSVAISLFIPLYINAYFIGNGFCKGSHTDPSPELKKECRAAYILAAQLTGFSQLIALILAPAFGYLCDQYRRFNIPLLAASVFGIIGYISFPRLTSPEMKDIDGRGGRPIVLLVAALIGISQIGAIVCSLGLLGRGVLGEARDYNQSSQLSNVARSVGQIPMLAAEATPLLPGLSDEVSASRGHLKGSIAGVYSLSGGVAILLLTKLGGALFDNLSPGAPFYMMAIFYGILLFVTIVTGIYQEMQTVQKAD